MQNVSMTEAITAACKWRNKATLSETWTDSKEKNVVLDMMLNTDSQVLTGVTTEQLCATSFTKHFSIPVPYPRARKILDLRIRHNVLVIFLLISLLAIVTSAKAENGNDICSIETIDSYFLPRELCPMVHLSADHWVHAKRELGANKFLKLSDIFPFSFKQVGFLAFVASSMVPWWYIKDITIHVTDIILFWEVNMVCVWACNFSSSITYYLSWTLFDIMVNYEDTGEATDASVVKENLFTCLIYAILLSFLVYRQREFIQGYMDMRRVTHICFILLLCSVCWSWLSIALHIKAFGILGWISMVPMYITRCITAKRFKKVPFVLKVGRLIGLLISHDSGANWLYERAYEAGIVFRSFELLVPCLPRIISTVKRQLHKLVKWLVEVPPPAGPLQNRNGDPEEDGEE